MGCFPKFFGAAMLGGLVCFLAPPPTCASAASEKQKSLDEWRSLTSPTAEPPRVFVKGDQIRFYFQAETNVVEFSADWDRFRIPTRAYKVHSAMLHWNQRLSRIPEGAHAWHEATVISGAEWHRLATNLIAALAPQSPGHAAYYQAFLADGLLYRDIEGVPKFALLGEQPKDVVIDHRYSVVETLQILARVVDENLTRSHPGGSLFLVMAPDASRFTQPLLLDRQQKRCLCLTPAALYDTTERGLTLTATAQGFIALVPESHGLALLKNPVSSAARLCDIGLQTAIRFLRLPLPKLVAQGPPVGNPKGMDLAQWEMWLDRYTGTQREDGSLNLLIDGDRFFSRLRQAIGEATNHVWVNVFIFDKDDVAVRIADLLKQRSEQVDIRIILDRMGSIAAGMVPPATPLPEDFVAPSSMSAYLAKKSQVKVRAFLNPWFSTEHSKVFLIDGTHAWIGGMNLGREYRYEWHDMMVELEGPIVTSLEGEFRREWAHEGLLGDLAYTIVLAGEPIQAQAPPSSDQWIKIRRLPTKTFWKPFSAAVLKSLQKAQSYIYIENPYLFDKRVISDLVRARQRGVDVRVVLPRVNDFKTGGRSNLVVANYLFQHGVRVYFYPGMTHAKALLVDGWACVGSANLNNLSLRYTHEQNIATSDPAFAAHLKQELFTEDFARSYELNETISIDWMDSLADLILENF